MGYKILITAPDIDPKAMALLDRWGATVFTAPAYSSEDALAKIAASGMQAQAGSSPAM